MSKPPVLQAGEYLPCHRSFDCRPDEEKSRSIQILLRKAVAYAVERALRRFPVFIRSRRVNAPFKFAAGQIVFWRF